MKNMNFMMSVLVIMTGITSQVVALPIEVIKQKGEYLKGLITSVNLNQFKKDTAVFFDFDPEFPPTPEAMIAYKTLAFELVEHAKVTRAEKFEERKLLLGSTVHNTRALLKSLTCGVITLSGVGCTLFCLSIANRHGGPIALPLAIAGGPLTGLFAYLTRKYWRLAVNRAEIIRDQTQTLNAIIEQAREINNKMNA